MYRLRPSVELFPASTGDLYMLRPGKGDLVVRHAAAQEVALAEALVEGGTAAELLRRGPVWRGGARRQARGAAPGGGPAREEALDRGLLVVASGATKALDALWPIGM